MDLNSKMVQNTKYGSKYKKKNGPKYKKMEQNTKYGSKLKNGHISINGSKSQNGQKSKNGSKSSLPLCMNSNLNFRAKNI